MVRLLLWMQRHDEVSVVCLYARRGIVKSTPSVTG